MTNEKQATDQPATLTSHYHQLVQSGEIKDDEAQKNVLSLLDNLNDALAMQATAGTFDKLFRKQAHDEAKGMYIWGGVGRGKSMLMDLFFEHAPVERKRRVHFHAFMREVHARIHQLRQSGQRGRDGSDPVVILAQQLASECSLLCFDELQATDVTDATLLYRLFQGLLEAGVVIVSTSNHPPASLYTGGIQRERFGKFISLLEENMQIAALSSPLDYRHLQLKSMNKTYFTPLGPEADAFIDQAIAQLCQHEKPSHGTLTIQGRTLHFNLYDQSIGRFTFYDLCETPLGPGDYLAIAKHLDTLILTGIPKLPAEKRNEAKRFVTLIDALYEQKVQLLCTAEVLPEQIYSEGDGAFEFQRTVSRLTEMQSHKWMEHE